jgi:hypothetical protein
MANFPTVPSHFTFPFVTTIQSSRYDARGRQMGFVETEVQRLERLAFANASKSRSGSPTDSLTSSSSGSPTQPMGRLLISEPFNDPIEFVANQLASELFGTEDFLTFFDEDPYSIPRDDSCGQYASSSFHKKSRTRKKLSLSLIPEED